MPLLPQLKRQPTPCWLSALDFTREQLPITDILQGSVFYPASAMDGRPVKYLGGYSHSFVYADWNVSQSSLVNNIDTFKGYRMVNSRAVERSELCFNSHQMDLPELAYGDQNHQHGRVGVSPYAVWTIYERLPEFDEVHGPQRFSLLFVGGEGVETFQSLYFSNQCAPSIITLSRCDAFTGNWTQFFPHKGILARSVMQNPTGVPDYIFCDFRSTPESPWPWYSKLEHTVAVPYGRFRLWSRGLGGHGALISASGIG